MFDLKFLRPGDFQVFSPDEKEKLLRVKSCTWQQERTTATVKELSLRMLSFSNIIYLRNT